MSKTIMKQISYEKLGKIKDRLAQGKKPEISRHKLYLAFLAEIDEDSQRRLKRVDEVLGRYINYLGENGGWSFSSTDIKNNSSENLTPTYTTLHLLADEKGYHLQPEPPKGLDIGYTRETEKRLLEKHKTELSIIHQSYMVKNDIIFNRRYTLKNPNREAIVEEMRELLGYNNPANVLVPKEEVKEIVISL